MEITATELRGKPGQMIAQAARGTEVIITIRGKRKAMLIPYRSDEGKKDNEDELFGLWKDREDLQSVGDYLRSIRTI